MCGFHYALELFKQNIFVFRITFFFHLHGCLFFVPFMRKLIHIISTVTVGKIRSVILIMQISSIARIHAHFQGIIRLFTDVLCQFLSWDHASLFYEHRTGIKRCVYHIILSALIWFLCLIIIPDTFRKIYDLFRLSLL